jgi:hypothetical protein
MKEWELSIRDFQEEENDVVRACKVLLAKFGYGIIKKDRVKVLHTQASIDPYVYDELKNQEGWMRHVEHTMSYDLGREIFDAGFIELTEEKPRYTPKHYSPDNERYVKRAKLLVIKPKEK